ncbi:MAG TPA: serine hydrolase domain-containing protein, partial [Gemmatimonadaceae bacterium]|nr:serine hydrolase domain-containing protein [Gemmatimonadaceae bacterium]
MIRRFALIALLLCTCARDRETALRPEQSQAIDRLIASQMKAYRIPSAAVAVIRNGVVVKEVAVGATKSTPFQLASTTKSFAATGVLLLVRDGRFTLDSRVGDLLDGLPPSWRGVTVRQLLSHTSGLPDIVRTPGQLDLIA